MEKNELKEDLENKNNKDVERQIERYSPVFVEPIKTKKELKEEIKKFGFSKEFIKRAPDLLDEFVKFYNSGADMDYNIVIATEDNNIKLAEIICSYLSGKGISSNALLTQYNYRSQIRGNENYCSLTTDDFQMDDIGIKETKTYKNIFNIYLIHPFLFANMQKNIDAKYPFTIFNVYKKNEEINNISNHANSLGFVFDNKRTLNTLFERYKNYNDIKGAVTRYAIDKKIEKKEQVIKLEEIQKYFHEPVKRNRRNKQKEAGKGIDSFDSIIGLESVKKQVERIAKMLEKNKDDRPMLHMAFLGNPGTGKTSIARVIANEFYERKIIKENKLLEVSRVDLVGSYIGHTAEKTKNVIQSAMGGILFIDEAYSLAISKSDKDFGPEALATLVKEMEDKRDDIVVIFAGYEKEVMEMISVNRGLESRIAFKIKFEDYSVVELMQILNLMISKTKYTLQSECLSIIEKFFEKEKEKESFSNGRFVRNFFERLKLIQADRSTGFEITKEDVLIAVEEEPENKDSKRKFGFVI
ncbi:MAG: AAA family ATPase [Christensenellales bacterium]